MSKKVSLVLSKLVEAIKEEKKIEVQIARSKEFAKYYLKRVEEYGNSKDKLPQKR